MSAELPDPEPLRTLRITRSFRGLVRLFEVHELCGGRTGDLLAWGRIPIITAGRWKLYRDPQRSALIASHRLLAEEDDVPEDEDANTTKGLLAAGATTGVAGAAAAAAGGVLEELSGGRGYSFEILNGAGRRAGVLKECSRGARRGWLLREGELSVEICEDSAAIEALRRTQNVIPLLNTVWVPWKTSYIGRDLTGSMVLRTHRESLATNHFTVEVFREIDLAVLATACIHLSLSA